MYTPLPFWIILIILCIDLIVNIFLQSALRKKERRDLRIREEEENDLYFKNAAHLQREQTKKTLFFVKDILIKMLFDNEIGDVKEKARELRTYVDEKITEDL